ncbi:hypothetical protein OEZ85_000291 [Tetradesmus obliquus]|uniref:Peptidoglycan binding-like domain-containing protein n=1 Tax=Tetradesmus obliquus TaxID=3088 RepID=A0ABY8UPT4_TETOB|nr:hypothetical protein OEZ85_000291 [Tetradesmus obliquus]
MTWKTSWISRNRRWIACWQLCRPHKRTKQTSRRQWEGFLACRTVVYWQQGREQQLWERQQALLDRMQQHWDNERQAWMQREQSLLAEVATLRQEMRQLLSLQMQQQQQQQQVVPSRPAAAAAVPDAASFAGPGAAAGSSSGSNSADPAASNSPAAAVISGPSSASAAVAEAIRAVRDAHANPPAASSMEDTSPGAWENLFGSSSSSSSAAADSVAAAIAAVDDTDVLLNMDLSFGSSSSSSSRGRRRVAFDAASSSSSSDEGSVDSKISSSSTSSTASSDLNPAAAEAAISDSVTNTESNSALIEVQKGDPAGPPPLLNLGDDDIFWVSKLHSGLMAAGFYPSDEEVENWVFGEATQGALLMFQACNDVAETGTTCDASWRKLLGEAEYLAAHAASSSSPAAAAAAAEAAAVQGQEVITYSFSSSSSSSSAAAPASSSSSSSSSSWPVLLEMDGGREVHALQVALGRQGYHCGDDEMRWWQFGSSTLDALKTYQACNGLPESGATDERTWLALLGADATPNQLQELRGEESSYEEDMAEPEAGAVWLLGEQRWSRPVNGTS